MKIDEIAAARLFNRRKRAETTTGAVQLNPSNLCFKTMLARLEMRHHADMSQACHILSLVGN